MDEVGPVIEVTTGVISCQLIAEDGVTHVQKSQITSATLSLVDEASGVVINSRDKEDALSKIDADGKFTWPLAVADTTPLSSADHAYYLAILAVTGDRAGGGTWTLRYRFRIIIDNWSRHE